MSRKKFFLIAALTIATWFANVWIAPIARAGGTAPAGTPVPQCITATGQGLTPRNTNEVTAALMFNVQPAGDRVDWSMSEGFTLEMVSLNGKPMVGIDAQSKFGTIPVKAGDSVQVCVVQLAPNKGDGVAANRVLPTSGRFAKLSKLAGNACHVSKALGSSSASQRRYQRANAAYEAEVTRLGDDSLPFVYELAC